MKSQAPRVAAVVAALLLVVGGAHLAGIDLLAGLRGRALVIKSLGGSGDAAGEAEAEGASAAPSVKEDFVIPLSDGEGDRYLRATVIIELQDDRSKDELRANLGRMRDAYIVSSADLSAEELDGHQGLDRSRALMQAAVERASPDIRLKGIYFSDYILR